MQHGTQWMENADKKRSIYETVIDSLKQYASPSLMGLFAEDLHDLKLFLPHCSQIHGYENNNMRYILMTNQLWWNQRQKRKGWRKVEIFHGDVHYLDNWDYDVIFLDTTWLASTTFRMLQHTLKRFNGKTTLILGVYSYNRETIDELTLIDRVQTIALKSGLRVPDARHITTYSTSSNPTKPWCEMIFAKFDFIRS